MSSAFNLLTAGGAKFDKQKYKHDIDLFSAKSKKDKGKGKSKNIPSTAALPSSLDFFGSHPPASAKRSELEDGSDSGSDSDASSSSSPLRPAPPTQKITITGPDPLPKSLHANLPSLLSHDESPTTHSQGGPLLAALKSANIHSLWGVQCAVSGSILSGHDTMCIAPTGSGKTLAYVLPTMIRLGDTSRELKRKGKEQEGQGIRCVVLVPTGDLAVQIAAVVRTVARGRKWRIIVLGKDTEKAVGEASPGNVVREADDGYDQGGAEGEVDDEEDGALDEDDDESSGSVNEFTKEGEKGDGTIPLGIDFLIATPERLHHLVDSGRVSLSQTHHLILDEADRLLSPDFFPQVEPILEACEHPSIQKSFFSATMPSGVEEIGRKYLRNGGVRVVVGIKDSATSTIDQSLLFTSTESGKLVALKNLVSTGNLPYPSLIFVQSIARADELYNTLLMEGLRVDVVHSGRGKHKREEAVNGFREGRIWVLVVTEVLARGMDFRGVKVVVNYDFPQTVQSYIHRIGRTGRAGRPGKAITFYNTEDGPYLRTIANVLTASGCKVPEYMLDLPKPSKNQRQQLAKAPLKRKEVGGGGRDIGKEEGKRKKAMKEGSQRRKERPAGGDQEGGSKKVKVDLEE
ncbi:ATP-dependent RNA helicase DDX52/ROK1, partial [Tremellales sp. Uapishka_1]